MHLPEALAAPRQHFLTASGERIAYYADTSGTGRPLVLIHSINAAPSSFELQPLFAHYQGQRPVYSLDLIGFGHSERPDCAYTPARFSAVIAEFLTKVVQQPADVLALSLSSEFAARATLAAPALVHSLVLISPTGFMTRPLPSARAARITHRLLRLPGLSQWLYNLVASRRSIRYFLGRSFVGAVPEALIDYAHATAHQPGARHAPLTFLSMQLFTPDAPAQLYDRLALPVLVIADQDPYITFERLDAFVAAHSTWRSVSLAPHLGMPQWEKLPEVVAALAQFWEQVEVGKSSLNSDSRRVHD
ncbi:alpha/beta hydrolase [Chromatium okenii]|uniref:Alpha/beta hydrolase n=1 Tax=Chromatium okenii TaxID=61644 RepID=A0A2S7XSM4_9GAMM|nr:alpha/beta hydrolase [Chromatium okenii]